MNIYLDIDGVILANDLHKSNYADEFIKHLVSKYPVYWLTTHCKGDAMITVRFLERFFDDKTIEIMKNILPTNWDILKTEAIDFSKPFLWFDDDLFAEEREVLIKNNCLNSWVEVNLVKDNNQLKKYLQI